MEHQAIDVLLALRVLPYLRILIRGKGPQIIRTS